MPKTTSNDFTGMTRLVFPDPLLRALQREHAPAAPPPLMVAEPTPVGGGEVGEKPQTPLKPELKENQLVASKPPVFHLFSGKDIVRLVAKTFGTPVDEIIGPQRSQHITQARFAAALLMWEELKYSYPRMGRMLGNRDHTTMINAISRARYLMRQDPLFKEMVESVRARIKELRGR